MSDRPDDIEVLKKARTHVEYEHAAFKETCRAMLAEPKHPQPIRNALYVATMVHLRCLCDFFVSNPKGPEDDIRATDFGGPAQTLPKVLEDAREISNKQIVHLTYQRNQLSDEGQGLPWGEMEAALDELVVAFLKAPIRGFSRLNLPTTMDSNTNAASDQVSVSFIPVAPQRRRKK
jgi:hypothetical protein